MRRMLICFMMYSLTISPRAAASDLTTAIESGDIDEARILITNISGGINGKNESGCL